MVATMTTALLSSRISSRTARVAVIGLGYVGLPLAVAFARAGFPVVGVDVDEKKVAALNAGRSYIGDVSDEDLRPHVASGRLRATTDYDALREADAIFICVPTPYDAQRAPDLSFVRAAAEGIRPRLRPGHLVVLQSTTYPGTTEEVVQPILEASGLRAGVDFYLAFSPERIDPGNKQWSAYNTPKVVGGVDPESTRLACDLLGQMGAPVHPVSSPRAAEMTKLLENIFRSVNIALVNELALLAERMRIDFWEVIEAAKTKPFGFMPFYPGAGVGGHCLAPGEYITIRGENGCEILPIQSCFERVSGRSEIHGVILAQPSSHLEILSFNPQTGETCFRPLRYISARRYEGAMVEVLTADGRRLKVTDGHPMLVWDKEEICIRRADALKAGDDLLVAKGLPVKGEWPGFIDLVTALPPTSRPGIRVTPREGHFGDYWASLQPHLQRWLEYPRDVFRYNSMPLDTYLVLEQEGAMPFSHDEILLCTGRGSSFQRVPGVIPLDEDFARMIGYYLSEGCITEDSSLRVRFTFNTAEQETIQDLESILERLGIRFSIYKDRQWNALHVKVSSRLFALLLRDVLRCGTNSRNMQIPAILMSAPPHIQIALLSGLLRGDGDVHHIQETRTYTRKGRSCQHYINTATVGYFSASPVLFQQVILLLQAHGFLPTFKKNKPQLRIYGEQQLARLCPLFADTKRQKLEAYASGRRKRMPVTQSEDHGFFATVKVREVNPAPPVDMVYSVEVDDFHTFVTSYGIVVHNCIPVDPYYLSWKAREYDFYTKFIELAAEVNQAMPYHAVDLVAEALSQDGLPLKGARVLVLGVAFKPDVDDPRNSPAERVIELLLARGAEVRYHDPYIPRFTVGGDVFYRPNCTLDSVPLTDEELASADCVVIVTGHRSVDYARVVQKARRVVDCCNATRGTPPDRRVVRLGAPFPR
jgi:UDP-N-acetyl-D-mannosaminuronate dehydrogenase/intein/homing endonuclease